MTLNDKGYYVFLDNNGRTRTFDAERSALEFIGRNIGISSSGEVRIISELDVCTSCQGAIENFKQIYPGVSISVESSSFETIRALRDHREGN